MTTEEQNKNKSFIENVHEAVVELIQNYKLKQGK